MINDNDASLLIVYDDRQVLPQKLTSIAGPRCFGDIRVKNRSIFSRFSDAVANVPNVEIYRLVSETEGSLLAARIAHHSGQPIAFFSANAAIEDQEKFEQIVQRLRLAQMPLVDSTQAPTLLFYPDSKQVPIFDKFLKSEKLSDIDEDWRHYTEFEGDMPYLDISDVDNFLKYISGATQARHFNQMAFDDMVYSKKSSDVRKIEAEYNFFNLIPNQMKAWMVTPFNFKKDGNLAQYSMLRLYFADASFQWIHSAWPYDVYIKFLSKLLHFLDSRPTKPVPSKQAGDIAQDLFVTKVKKRWETLLNDPKGKQIYALLCSAPGGERIASLMDDYLKLYDKHQKRFETPHLATGHGDPCLSNILFDAETLTLRLIDPKGAITEDELWTHPIYDYCKISHSIMGDYDFINNKLFDVALNGQAEPTLHIHARRRDREKKFFQQNVGNIIDWKALRLGEASLFISMTPLHLDHPDKVAAFILNARSILDSID